MIKVGIILWVLATSTYELPRAAVCLPCASERATVVNMQAIYDAALQAWQIAYNDWLNDPNPITAAELAIAQIDLDAAQQVLAQAQQALSDCLEDQGGPGGSLDPADARFVSILEQ